MKLATPHQRSSHQRSVAHCLQCQVIWPCDAAIACEEVETLNKIVARYVDGWVPNRTREPNGWAATRGPHKWEPMSDAEAVVLRPHLEKNA